MMRRGGQEGHRGQDRGGQDRGGKWRNAGQEDHRKTNHSAGSQVADNNNRQRPPLQNLN